ncbi:methyltransferase domain-containing protein [Nocardioides sp. TRM66260-LWL]|uniref:methyltransferase domain-containing protein n=1 Tax=Nocardioides sp. TRM66260-LWL TaxID=2874478 RepID=UPI001CC687BE|nr:methyltransferase domain-containing protein [Nocardioides sp. TRM66260-LWL]MBZ5734462.1 methyltransferase domain-containing protein [Nocardioides sp. TRM66260-LWL]
MPGAGDVRWEPAASGPSSGFRNKAKMVVGGTLEQPTLGILDAGLRGVDLRDCGLHEPALRAALPVLAELVTRARLTPYDVAARRGELKHLIVTVSPDGALMVRLVLRSTEGLPRVRKQLDWLTGRLPVAVLSVNLQPEHKAVLEGPEEIVLTAQETLPMRLGALTLHLRPQGFFQTNTAMAARLYATARAWTDHLAPRSVLDLYCGVGGFALHLAAPGRRVHGLEISADAVRAARRSAAEAGLAATFAVGDAVAEPWGGGVGDERQGPDGPGPWDLVVVNPPRRGLGEGLCARLRAERPGAILYSSCSPASLARDLTALGGPSAGAGGPRGYRPVRAQVVDLFPQTAHAEVLVLLEPTPPVGAGQRPG